MHCEGLVAPRDIKLGNAWPTSVALAGSVHSCMFWREIVVTFAFISSLLIYTASWSHRLLPLPPALLFIFVCFVLVILVFWISVIYFVRYFVMQGDLWCMS